ncbi:putative HTLV-1-related endogenous sequence [Delphinus delphis]|uniref:putative HTLV-1-related endogenous sequence n=1 Tax=Delphinus delphis TaxID=9728 RepID=UPI003752FC5B
MVPGDPRLPPAERGPGGSHREQDPPAVPGVGELSGPRLVSEEGSDPCPSHLGKCAALYPAPRRKGPTRAPRGPACRPALTPRPAPAGLDSDRTPSLRVARSRSQQWQRRRRAGPGRGHRAIGLPPPARHLPSCRSRGLTARCECVRVAAAAALTQRARAGRTKKRGAGAGGRSPWTPRPPGPRLVGGDKGDVIAPRMGGSEGATGLEAGDGEKERCGLRNPEAAAGAQGDSKRERGGGS